MFSVQTVVNIPPLHSFHLFWKELQCLQVSKLVFHLSFPLLDFIYWKKVSLGITTIE